MKTIKILFDSGASETIVSKSVLGSIKTTKTSNQQWNTAGGVAVTAEKATIQFALPEFYEKTIIQTPAHVFSTPMNYDLIIGRDLLTELGISLDFYHQKTIWQDAEIPMKLPNATINSDFYIQDNSLIENETNRIKKILDAKYEPANLEEIAESALHLSKEEQQQLYQLLSKYKSLFDAKAN